MGYKLYQVKGLLFLALCLCVIVWCVEYDKSQKHSEPARQLLSIPSDYLPFITIGHKSLIADILWMDLIFKLGDAIKKKNNKDFVLDYLWAISELSPSFQGLYEFSGTILPQVLHDPHSSISLLKRGLESVSKNNERYWFIPFYLGFVYYYYLNDNINAAKYFEIASRCDFSPRYMALLAASMKTSSVNIHDNIKFIDNMLEQIEDPYIVASLRKKREKLVDKLNLQWWNEYFYYLDMDYLLNSNVR